MQLSEEQLRSSLCMVELMKLIFYGSGSCLTVI